MGCRAGSGAVNRGKILRRPAAALRSLQEFNCPIQLVALCDEEREDVVCRHASIVSVQRSELQLFINNSIRPVQNVSSTERIAW